VILHGIYSSARERTGEVSGEDLFNAVRKRHPRVYYFEKVESAADFCKGLLSSGDVFITMGAGDNWKLGRIVLGTIGGR